MSHGHGITIPTAEEVTIPAGHSWGKLPMAGLSLGVVGLIATFVLGAGDPGQLYHSYLVAFLYFLSLALGALIFTLVQFAVRAGWSVVVRRTAESLMAPFPALLLLFIPIVFGMGELYHWSHPEKVAGDAILEWKSPYLNTKFFVARAGVYFAVWIGLSMFFRRASRRQDTEGGVDLTRKMQNVSGPSIAAFAFTLSFAALDWGMSLDPHWYSTMWGVYYFAGSWMAIHALLAVMHLLMEKQGLLRGIVTVEHYHDLGKLLFAFTIFWTYIAFCQYFLIWYANIPEETAWFAHREGSSWATMGAALLICHFFLPFLFLVQRKVKRHRGALMFGALWMLGMHYVDLYFIVMPSYHRAGVHFSLVDVASFVGIGGIFFGVATLAMKKAPLIPVKDPRLRESLAFENF
jgi:hypothetical protein